MQRLALAGLVECELPRAQTRRNRQIYVTKEINDLLTGKVLTNPEFPCENADHVIGIFVRGYIVGVSRSHASKCELKWLKGLNEVWVLNFREPQPGWRLFGRFARKNFFIGLHCVSREEAGDLLQYAAHAKMMCDKWDALFPNEKPFSGFNFEDYLGDMVTER